MSPALVENFVILITFGAITCHSGDTIKNDGVFLFYLGDELLLLGAVLSCTCEEFFDDNSGRIDGGNVGDLSSDLLMLCAYAAITVNHNVGVLSVLKQSTVSFVTIIMPCFELFVSAFGQKLVLCLQRFLLVLN